MSESILTALNSGNLKGAKQLDLQGLNLDAIPEAVFTLADTLEVLSLNNNRLTKLPETFKSLKKLKILFCSDNPFTELPTVLGECPLLEMIGFKACRIKHVPAESLPTKLRWLILTNNQIESLPESIGDCQRLQKLMLAGNQLQSITASLMQCRKLELIRLSANQFTEFPNWLYTIPNLTWVALAGNPVNSSLEASALSKHQLKLVRWNDLTLNHQLGEGASGEIYHAHWHTQADETKPVAVKVFKGEMTSDGLPQSELAAAVAAGSHRNLTSTIGIVNDHPEGKKATIMSLLDPRFKVLAGPPSFTSCTRDIYAEEFSLSTAAASKIALQIALAVAHLHQRGLIHGDLYAHNILLDDNYETLLSDFGGAAFVPQHGSQTIMAQKVEVRAYGILIEELLQHINTHALTDNATQQLEALMQIKNACISNTINKRPSMREVVNRLNA